MQTVRYVNEFGRYVGEDNARAVLTAQEVELMRSLHDEGMSIAEIARKFERRWSTVRDACLYITWSSHACQPVRCPRSPHLLKPKNVSA